MSLAGLSTAAAVAGPAVLSPATAAGRVPRDPAHRAVATERALQKYFAADHGLLHETYPNDGQNPYSYEWPYSQAVIGAIDLAGMRHGWTWRTLVRHRIDRWAAYWNPDPAFGPPHYDSYVRPPLGGGGDAFYDDNEWVALALLEWHYLTGDRWALRRAAEIFELIVYGWDDDPSHPYPGGVFWTQASWSTDRNTVSNGPGAQVGAHLYLLTGRRRYLHWAKRMVEWTDGCLLAPNGLYWDHVALDGTIEKTQWSYNQGVMLGAKTLLYKATRDHRYLRQARDIERAALEFYGAVGADGQTAYFTQPAEFNAIFFANCLQLDALRHGRAGYAAMRRYAAESDRSYLDHRTGLYRFDGDQPVTLLHQAAMVRINAMLAWSPNNWHKLT